MMMGRNFSMFKRGYKSLPYSWQEAGLLILLHVSKSPHSDNYKFARHQTLGRQRYSKIKGSIASACSTTCFTTTPPSQHNTTTTTLLIQAHTSSAVLLYCSPQYNTGMIPCSYGVFSRFIMLLQFQCSKHVLNSFYFMKYFAVMGSHGKKMLKNTKHSKI